MLFARLLSTAFATLCVVTGAYALPPTHGGAGNQGVNPAANAADAMASCMASCTPHCTNRAICTNRCNTVIHQIGLAAPSAYAGLPSDAASCAVLEAGAWSWYGTCSYLVGVASGSFSSVASQSSFLSSVSTVLGVASSSVVAQALHVDDPCGYIRDQMIHQYMTVQQCPQSTILPALGIKQSILPPPK
ncbi:MAG TPA: hypothetical protein VFK87_00345 [Steroidobacteraceae bacterium]|nr:hypothetical protein [Steroidobacteraceae bacterium]